MSHLFPITLINEGTLILRLDSKSSLRSAKIQASAFNSYFATSKTADGDDHFVFCFLFASLALLESCKPNVAHGLPPIKGVRNSQ